MEVLPGRSCKPDCHPELKPEGRSPSVRSRRIWAGVGRRSPAKPSESQDEELWGRERPVKTGEE